MHPVTEELLMLALAGNVRIFLHSAPTDLRKGFEGLCGAIQNAFTEVPTNGAYFVFLNHRRDRMKVLYWDADGLAIWYKRLEKGSFPRPSTDKILLDRRDFFMLLEGVVPKRMQTRYKIV
jgi:transposase